MANESTIHTMNLKFLLTEVYKFLNGLSPPIINEMFKTNDYPYRRATSLGEGEEGGESFPALF